MSEKWIARIVLVWSIVFLIGYLYRRSQDGRVLIVYARINNRPYNPSDFINLGFSLFEFEQAKARDIQRQHDYDLTALLLLDKQLPVIRQTVQRLLHLSVFKQIIVWNDNPTIKLTTADLIAHNCSTRLLRIINAESSLGHLAKYHACCQANTRACFYIGDTENALGAVQSLLAGFRSDPTALHLITDSYILYGNVVAAYLNATIDSYEEPSETNYGMLFHRDHAREHLQMTNDSLIHSSDRAVVIWFHDTRPRPSSIPTQSTRHPLHAFQRAPRVVQSTNEQFMSRFSYLIKSPSLNDDFVFYSNVHPFGTPNHVPENEGERRASYTTLPGIWKAVDNDLSSCWSTHRNLQADDFFAIDFLRPQSSIVFTITIAHHSILQQNLEIRISFDGVWWIPYRSLKGIYTKVHLGTERALQTIVFDSAQFNLGFRSFRYLSFHTRSRSHQRFHVCNVELLSPRH